MQKSPPAGQLTKEEWLSFVLDQPYQNIMQMKQKYIGQEATNLQSLDQLIDYMRRRSFLQFFKHNLSQQQIHEQKTKRIRSQIQKMAPNYEPFINQKEISKNELLRKTRPNPNPHINYFACFHDLEALDTIKELEIAPKLDYKQENIKQLDSKVDQYLYMIKRMIFNEPKRPLSSDDFQKVRAQVDRKREEFKNMQKAPMSYLGQQFQEPAECELMTADELQEKILYSIDDLNLDFEWVKQTPPKTQTFTSKVDKPTPQTHSPGFLKRLQQSEMQFSRLSK